MRIFPRESYCRRTSVGASLVLMGSRSPINIYLGRLGPRRLDTCPSHGSEHATASGQVKMANSGTPMGGVTTTTTYRADVQ